MPADAHRKAAEDIESTILPLQAQPKEEKQCNSTFKLSLLG